MKIRTGVAGLALAVGLTACGSSAKTSTGGTVAATNSTSSSTTSTTTTAPAKKATKPKKKHKAPAHTATTTTSTTTTQSTPTASTPTTSTPTTTTKTTKTPKPTLGPLPSPYVSGSSGQMRAQLHGENHSPKIGVGWTYEVQATNAQGQPLTGSVAVQFLFNGSVVGHQSPPSLPLTNGRLTYTKDTFPPASKGIPLIFQAVVTTPLGKVTLNWPVKSHS